MILKMCFIQVLRIGDILVWIRISVSLINDPDLDPAPDPAIFVSDLKTAK